MGWDLDACGWPAPSMLSCRTFTHGDADWRTHGAAVLQDDPASRLVLPLRPIWSNTIWNTLFYAAIPLGLHQLLVVSKRALRKRRGLCTRCKYDLSGSAGPGCPECGWGRVKPGA